MNALPLPDWLTTVSRSWARALIACLLAIGLGSAALAQSGLQPVPTLSSHVIDETGTLDAAQRQALDAKLTAYEQKRGAQIVMLIVATTLPEDIAAYAQRVGDNWKIGRQNIGDGLLLVVSKNDRRVRIETTRALEGAMPDLAARQIIDSAITPSFRQNDYAGGLNAANVAGVSPQPVNDAAQEAELKANMEFAGQLGATGTPLFIVGDRVINSAPGYPALKAAVEAARKG